MYIDKKYCLVHAQTICDLNDQESNLCYISLYTMHLLSSALLQVSFFLSVQVSLKMEATIHVWLAVTL